MAPEINTGRALRETKRALARFRNTRPASLAATLWRALRLNWREPTPPPVPARRERVVITLTTIPGRARHIRPVLRSLLDQSEPADRIVLALPKRTLRGEAYPDIGALGLPRGIDIISCQDHGPATKLLPALRLEPEAVLIVADDDVIYPRGFVATLLAEHRRNRNAALGFRGVRRAAATPFFALDHVFATGVATTTPVDILFGTWGYLLPPGLLGEAVHDFAGAPPQVRWVDDIWISGHLARAGVPRLVVPSGALPIETWSSLRQALTSGINRSGENDEVALKHFAKDW